MAMVPSDSSHTSPPPASVVTGLGSDRRVCIPRLHRQRGNPPHHSSTQTPRQMTIRQQQPVIHGVFDQSATRLHQPLLQVRQRSALDPWGEHQSPSQVPQDVGDQAQPQSHLARPESVATQPRYFHRLYVFFDPLRCGSLLL
ncbi:MAG: hypothetical protein ABIU05_14395 [Nitrospirales bacterium]